MATQQPQYDLNKMLEELIAANKQFAGSVGNQQNFTDAFKNAVQQKFANNQDLINLQGQQAAGYFNAPSQAREKFQNIFDPFARERLVSEYQNQQGQGLDVASELLKERRGSQADILEQGKGTFQSYLQGQQQGLEGKQNVYNLAYKQRQDELDTKFKNKQFSNQQLQDFIQTGAIANFSDKTLKDLAANTGMTFNQLKAIQNRIKLQLKREETDRKYELDQRKKVSVSSGGGSGRRSSGLTPYQQLQQQNRQQRSEAQQEQAFKNSVANGLKQLQSGVPWGPVWNAIKAQYPNVPNNVIDQFLQADYWRQAGAYQNYIATQQSAKG